MSEGGKRVMEVDDFAALKGCPWPDFWAGEGNEQAKKAVVAAREGRMSRFQNEANTARGNPRYWDVQVSPVYTPDGQISHLLSISRDITEEWTAARRREADFERHKFLTQELTHRVKNTLATVMGIASLSFRGEAHKDVLKNFMGRVSTLDKAYNLLSETSWTTTSVRNLAEGALAPYRTGTGRFSIAGPDYDVKTNQALTLALAINELATNAMKYGSLTVPGGKVQVEWDVEDRFRFSWRESGGPAVQTPLRTGFGSRLIKNLLAQDFGGTVDLRYEASGLTCQLDAPRA
ncbi:MAG: HWE histidine kinase domain-containing protein, partial [Rhizomicrobium sp.]